MKIIPLLLLVTGSAFIGSYSIAESPIEVGDTRAEVMDVLGEPNGVAQTRDYEAYTFDRGQVIFHEGRVRSYSLVSEDEAARLRETAKAEQEERRQEGEALREAMAADSTFAELSPNERLAFWQAFRHRYPEVNARLELGVALRESELERNRSFHESQLRLRESEQMARLGRKQAPHTYGYGAGFPYIFTDPFPPKEKVGIDRFGIDRFARPTPRERFMPLDNIYSQRFSRSEPLRTIPRADLTHPRNPTLRSVPPTRYHHARPAGPGHYYHQQRGYPAPSRSQQHRH